MNSDEIKDKIKYALINEGIYVNNDDEMISDYIADSISFVSLIVQIECQLDIDIPDEVLSYERLGSVNSLAAFVETLINPDRN